MLPLDPKRISVEQWGYSCLNDSELRTLVWPVRFKPGVTMALVLVGLLFNWSGLLIAVGFLGLVGTAFSKLSWIDLIYNHLVRYPFKVPPIPPDPRLRRAACGTADLCVLISGIALAWGHVKVAWLLGGLVLILAGSVVFTGICLPVFLIHRRITKR